MKVSIRSEEGAPVQIDVELRDGTQLYLTESEDGQYLRARKMRGLAENSDTILVSPVCSNVVEVG